MAQQTINIGTVANDGTGDPLRTAWTKANGNFTELYARPTGGSGTINSGTLNTIAYYAASGTALSPLTLGTGLSVSGTTLNATGGSGSGTVNSGTANTLAFYAASGTVVSALTLGTNLSITGTTLNAAGGGGLSSIANNNLLANTSGSSAVPVATTVSALLDGALGSAQGDVLYRSGSGWAVLTPGSAGQFLQSGGASANVTWASATGAGTVNSGTTNTLAFYAGSGTAVSPLTLGTNLSITGTTLNAAGGGGSFSRPVTTVAASGASQALTFATTSGDKAYDVTLTGNCAFTLTGGNAGQAQEVWLIIRGGAGGFAPTLPSGIKWPGGVAPTVDTSAGSYNEFYLRTVDGGTTVSGNY